MNNNLNVILYYKNEKIIGFDISGHANYDEYGKDIVCAGVSVLAQTFIASIDKLTKVKKKDIDYQVSPGHTYIKINPMNIDKEVELLFKSFQIGLKGIQNSYRDYIIIIEQEVNLNDKRI